ncbi:ester cyclase [Bacillus haimaensis]|uniref:ester cyclase n=1 Tax=Bacillus haimaensis TaxID=3160967 RepID=UPI003AA9476C
MNKNQNVELIKRFYHEMWNQFDKSIFPELLTKDFRFRGSLGKYTTGYKCFREYVDFIQNAFPDFHNHIEEIISEGNKSFARLTYKGTHHGELFGIKPTNKLIEYSGAAVFHFKNERISEVWVLGDIYGLVQQLKDDKG